jgi:hypothetical protein
MGSNFTHKDPLEFRNLPKAKEDIPPYSSCPTPYRWMREEFYPEIYEAEEALHDRFSQARDFGWVQEPDRQIELLRLFWDKITPNESLVFYYCDQGNPLDESLSRVIVGIGRISEIGPQIYFGADPNYPDSYPVWSRRVSQSYPEQGVRLPYHEYLKAGHSLDGVICQVPQNALNQFTYVGEHVSDDVAVSVIERAIQCLERVKADGLVEFDWEGRLKWLNDVLDEVWRSRGPYPGVGSVLQFLGCSKGISFQRTILSPMARQGKNPWDYVLAILEGRIEPNDIYQDDFIIARDKWSKLRSRQELLAKLARLELTLSQVERIANNPPWADYGIKVTSRDLVENPYLIFEYDQESGVADPVALETIDHGLRPKIDLGLFPDADKIAHDDKRRVRAVGVDVLLAAANEGDTVLSFNDFLTKIVARFPEGRSCRPDREVMAYDVEFYRETLWLDLDSEPQLVALKYIQSLENEAAKLIIQRARKTNQVDNLSVDWPNALRRNFGEPTSDRMKAAFKEQESALTTLLTQKVSVLTGGAGTGKTSVLKVFLQELARVEGQLSTLLLAPTGKARVRLFEKTGQSAMTIHQFLLRQDWLNLETFSLKRHNNKAPFAANIVIIDECSMIPTDLFGTLLRALDSGPLRRLILVGDPNQLPPIGPGRPFVDIIEWLNKNHPDRVAPLSVCTRVQDNEKGVQAEDSAALTLADGYRARVVNPANDEILNLIARGQSMNDLDVAFWEDHDDLLAKLKSRLKDSLGIDAGDYISFNRSFGIDQKDWGRSESWQILSPTRAQHFGVEALNRLIQKEFKGGLINFARSQSKNPNPFGQFEIVWTDKVIQVQNRSQEGWAYPSGSGQDYVANGEIGVVVNTSKSKKGNDSLDVVFSTQVEASYRYRRPEIDQYLELAYALTIHKAQGSDFDTVFLIIPQKARILSRELIYTALTRFRKKLSLLIEKNIQPLLDLRSPENSSALLRNTNMFKVAIRPDPDKERGFHAEALIHRTRKNVAVRSKSEVIVANALDSLGISYEYEKPLYSRTDSTDFRLPDFTVSHQGDFFYWEHLGMLNVPSYREAWARKEAWYKKNGFWDQLIVSKDNPDGGIDAAEIERLAHARILGE